MKILLTGATGYFGAEILERLLANQRISVVAWGRDPGRLNALRARFAARPSQLVIETQDLLRAKLMLSDVDTIIHAAAIRPPTAGQDPQAMRQLNVEATENLIHIAERAGCQRFLYVSTQAVYGTTGAPWSEEAPLRPVTAYGRSKSLAESAVLQSAVSDVSILRVSRLYGVTPFTRWSELPGQFAKRVVVGEPLTIYGTGNQRYDLVHVRDAAQAVIQALTAPSRSDPHIYNVGGGGSVSLNSLCSIFTALAAERGLPEVRVHREPDHPGGAFQHLELDLSRISSELGWVPRVSLGVGLGQYLESLVEGPGRAQDVGW